MKTRTDFVTNSSSTCYIIAYKKNLFSKDLLKEHPYLIVFDNFMNILFQGEDESGIISTKKQLQQRICSEFLWDMDDRETQKASKLTITGFENFLKENHEKGIISYWTYNKYFEILEFIEKGFNVGITDVSYSDKKTRGIIDSLIDKDKFILVSKEND